MTIKKRLFISNILMLLIPAVVSLLMIAASVLMFLNTFYKQFMDETIRENSISQMHRVLMEQSRLFLGSSDNLEDSQLYQTVNKYLNTKDIAMEIHDGRDVICSLGNQSADIENSALYTAIKDLGGVGSITSGNASLYGEKITADGRDYTLYIYTVDSVNEDEENEAVVKQIVVVLGFLIVVFILATNRFLTRFITKKIEQPLDILVYGVHQIRDGNTDYRIEYSENDEFRTICDAFNEMAAKLKESIELTERNERSRKELIAGISHDLRTPLTSIKAYASGLIEGVAATPAMQQKYMQTILAKANAIDQIVDKLFLFSKLDLGDYPFYPEKVSLSQLIPHIISGCEKDMSDRGMTVRTAPIPENLTVYADPVQLENAFTNILENSLKYKDKDTVDVNISCEDLPKSVRITIDDNGPGVPEESVSKLFDVFYRSDPSRNNPHKGSGLGLAITAKILEHSGGKISAENLTPNGLRIVMTIPKEGAK